jgi:hypothetical protein
MSYQSGPEMWAARQHDSQAPSQICVTAFAKLLQTKNFAGRRESHARTLTARPNHVTLPATSHGHASGFGKPKLTSFRTTDGLLP